MNRLILFLSLFFSSVLMAYAEPIDKDVCTTLKLSKDTVSQQSLVVRNPWVYSLNHGKLDLKYQQEGLKYGAYVPLKELEFHSLPLLAFGFIAKGSKKDFRAARNNFIPSYKNGLDDIIQFGPFAASFAMNLAGYEGRSDFKRYFFSAGFSYAFMAMFVNGIKYTASEMRPDGTSANSFPSGHTATAFTAATIMHKEYGLTRSPWWSVLGYSFATTTGIMRTLNNRHWISDVLVGAGIGVISTDLGYMMADLWFKNKHLNREPNKGNYDMLKYPSFFRLSLGMQFTNDIKFPTENVEYITTQRVWNEAGAAEMEDNYMTIVRYGNPFRIPDDFNAASDDRTYNNYLSSLPGNQEGTTFYRNPRLKVGSGTTVSAEAAYFFTNYVGAGARGRITTAPVVADGLSTYDTNNKLLYSTSVTDVWSMADIGVGVYVAWPISSRHNISAKALYGRRFFGSLEFQSEYDIPITIEGMENEYIPILGDNLYIDSTSADNLTAGLTYTYSMGNGVAISAFTEYDYSKPSLTAEYCPYNSDVLKRLSAASMFKFQQRVKSLTIGASMTVLF